MATVEFGSGSQPLKTWSEAKSASSAGDTLSVVGIEEGSEFILDSDRVISSKDYKSGTFKANASGTNTFRTSGSLAAAQNPHQMEKFVVDANNLSTYALRVLQDASEDLNIELNGLSLRNGVTNCLFIDMRRGDQYFTDLDFSGNPTGAYIGSTASLGGDGNQKLVFNGVNIDNTTKSSSSNIIDLEKIDNLTNTLDVYISDVKGTTTQTGATSVIQIDVYGAGTVDISNCRHRLNATDDATGGNCILVRGKGVAVTANARVANNNVEFFSPAGYAIAFGQSETAANITSGGLYGNICRGKYYTSATPHLFLMGQGSNGDCIGNVALDGYVPFLISKTTNAQVRGNLSIDGYGPNYYVKGATNCNIVSNIAVLTGALIQRTNGILAVAAQGATNTLAATLSDNIIIVKDVSKIHSLAQIADASQTATFSKNVYFVPDTVDLSTAQLFAYQSSTPNNTLAQWNTNTSAGDKVIKLSPEAMDSMIDSFIGKYVDVNSYTNKSDIIERSGGFVKNTVRVSYDPQMPSGDITAAIIRAKDKIIENMQDN